MFECSGCAFNSVDMQVFSVFAVQAHAAAEWCRKWDHGHSSVKIAEETTTTRAGITDDFCQWVAFDNMTNIDFPRVREILEVVADACQLASQSGGCFGSGFGTPHCCGPFLVPGKVCQLGSDTQWQFGIPFDTVEGVGFASLPVALELRVASLELVAKFVLQNKEQGSHPWTKLSGFAKFAMDFSCFTDGVPVWLRGDPRSNMIHQLLAFAVGQ